MKLGGWGRYPMLEASVAAPRDERALADCVTRGKGIARGNGRAYGDSALSASNTIHMRHFNRMIAFDADTGQLIAESGVLLADILSAFLPRGSFPMVTPGTKFVTLGGMIAADVHGKNHHKQGSFAACVDWIDLMGHDGQIQRCARDKNPELFDWTLGGMGLTGIVIRCAIRLARVETAWISQRRIVAPNLDAAIAAFEDTLDSAYSVAWIDCLSTGDDLGRSLVMLGEHAKLADLDADKARSPLSTTARRPRSVPFDFPGWSLNTYTVRAFNALYFRSGQRQPETQLVDWDSYFYPLDALLGWNRIYGSKGFAQFQCVIPLAAAHDGLRALLSAISEAGAGSFLAVLKRFGKQDSHFSFPMEGYTLALDFPVNTKTLALMQRLDGITADHQGRIYLAKDSRLAAQMFARLEDRAPAFRTYRKDIDAFAAFASAQSERLNF